MPGRHFQLPGSDFLPLQRQMTIHPTKRGLQTFLTLWILLCYALQATPSAVSLSPRTESDGDTCSSQECCASAQAGPCCCAGTASLAALCSNKNLGIDASFLPGPVCSSTGGEIDELVTQIHLPTAYVFTTDVAHATISSIPNHRLPLIHPDLPEKVPIHLRFPTS